MHGRKRHHELTMKIAKKERNESFIIKIRQLNNNRWLSNNNYSKLTKPNKPRGKMQDNTK